MSNKLEKELVNYILSTGLFKLDELSRDTSGNSIWMLQSSDSNKFDEIAVFLTEKNYIYGRDKAIDYVNSRYIGEKGIRLSFVVISEADINKNELMVYPAGYIIGSSIIVVNPRELKITYSYGEGYAAAVINYYIKNKNIEKEATGFFKVPVTNILIITNILVFAIMVLSSGNIVNSLFSVDNETLLNFGALYGPYVRAGQYHRIISSMFLHANLIHLLLNMYALKIIGTLVENIYKSKKFSIIYAVSGIYGAIGSLIFSNSISVGASGAIFGLLGAAFVYAFMMRKKIGRAFINEIFKAIVINLLIGLSVSNIDNAAHIGGLIGGMLIAIFFELRRSGK